MKQNVTLSIGNVALIDKVDGKYHLFDRLFSGIGGKARNFKQSIKLFMSNRLGKCYSLHRIPQAYNQEFFRLLKYDNAPKERSLYRNLVRLGLKHEFVIERCMSFLNEEGLLSNIQFMDFSSSYFEGGKCELGELGYSREGQPGKKQLTFGISTGINGIPSALTIQKGNTQDKTHFRHMLKTAGAVLNENSLLIFDCGGNTRKNKELVREYLFHYLTLKPKKVNPYKNAILQFKSGTKEEFIINETKYVCVKVKDNNEYNYIYFSQKLYDDQIRKKSKNFHRELEKNKSILNKTKAGKTISKHITEEGFVNTKGSLQKTLEPISPHFNGIEGYFILESSIESSSEKILALYKDKDKAEKLIRDIKEGTELRPMRHWSTNAIIGYVLVVFLTNLFTNLTLHLAKNPVVKNVRLLKKILSNLTLVIIFSQSGFKHTILANFSQEIASILDDFPLKYAPTELNLAW